MKWAVITLTKGGLNQAHAVSNKLLEQDIETDIYTLPKWDKKKVNIIDGRLENFIGRIFNSYDILLFVMATGIVVRVIAKYIEHKSKDPGVLVMDENGEFVISLLSGHLGRANDMTKLLATLIEASPVITTASDVKGSVAVDTLSMELGCYIENLEEAKNITALIVNDEMVGIDSSININIPLPSNIIELGNDDDQKVKGIIYISNKKQLHSEKSMVQLIPKNIITGIGCRKGVLGEIIIDGIKSTLNKLNIHEKSIKCITTVDIKENEAGIIEAAQYFNVPLEIVSREDIRRVEDKFDGSEFVRNTIGVKAVCEPCGYITSNYGSCIMEKKACGGMTISIWEGNFNE